MKKIKFILTCLAITASLFTGCSNAIESKINSNDASVSREIVADADKTVNIKIYLFNAGSEPTVKTWNVWAWTYSTPQSNYSKKAWPGGDIQLSADATYKDCLSTSMKVDPKYDMGILFCNSVGGKPQTADVTIEKSELTEGREIFFVYGEAKAYYNVAECTGLRSATIINENATKIECKISGLEESSIDNSISVKDKNGEPLSIEKIENDEKSVMYTITLSDGEKSKIPYIVSLAGVDKVAVPKAELIDKMDLTYEGADLGLTLSGSDATFKVWAPTASKVEVLLYDDITKIGNYKPDTVKSKVAGGTDDPALKGEPEKIEDMVMGDGGVWSKTVAKGSYEYYKYRISIGASTYYVADINAKACAGDSLASQIIDINSDSSATYSGDRDNVWGTKEGYYNPFGSVVNGAADRIKKYSDAVIYEMHIRDWSRNSVVDSTGKFIDVANNEEFMKHLKDLGVTHVQILPMFDYAETNNNTKYNWGYNPYHYNVPEGRYTNYDNNEGQTGAAAVKQLREMVSKFHENGIAVIMDVVYNHTSGTGTNSLYDSTVPEYYYWQDAKGNYINYSGCGNGLNLDRKMVRKYVIDSLKHWVLDYHINGFRFDLMGIHSKQAMQEIYDALYDIDENIMIYGEPWTGDGKYPEEGCSGAVLPGEKFASAASKNGIGCFDDDFRDAIKGSEYGGFKPGIVQGDFGYSPEIANGLAGNKIEKNKRNETDLPQLALHYAECHDNYTLYDKLALCYLNTKEGGDLDKILGDKALSKIKKQDKLAAAYVILSQGTPFINGGQEFLRTKCGNDNSYNADDYVNEIKFDRKKKHMDVYQVYRGLIALRKDYKAFHDAIAADAKTMASGVTSYTVKDETNEFTVLFNATEKEYKLSNPVNGKIVDVQNAAVTYASFVGVGLNDTKANASKYVISNDEKEVSSIPGLSFVIIKTK